MKKELKDLTIQEFGEYNDMLNMDEPDIFGIFEIGRASCRERV